LVDDVAAAAAAADAVDDDMVAVVAAAAAATAIADVVADELLVPANTAWPEKAAVEQHTNAVLSLMHEDEMRRGAACPPPP
jgi:hypothetical protein